LRSAKPCSLSRFFKYRQTFFAFFNFISQPLFAISRRSHFSEAFDYALLFQTASTSKEVFLPDSLAINSEESIATHLAVTVSRALDYAQFPREWSTKAKIFTKESLAARQAGHWVRQLTTHTTN
ncbi:hypothetical protein, partial [Variovorax sp. RCC_210]|uniref:hypothetical protein n=1 Tax=Variovorax sp. RCC_210 TaxID=3239217 RepID=UPI003523D3C3